MNLQLESKDELIGKINALLAANSEMAATIGHLQNLSDSRQRDAWYWQQRNSAVLRYCMEQYAAYKETEPMISEIYLDVAVQMDEIRKTQEEK